MEQKVPVFVLPCFDKQNKMFHIYRLDLEIRTTSKRFRFSSILHVYELQIAASHTTFITTYA